MQSVIFKHGKALRRTEELQVLFVLMKNYENFYKSIDLQLLNYIIKLIKIKN